VLPALVQHQDLVLSQFNHSPDKLQDNDHGQSFRAHPLLVPAKLTPNSVPDPHHCPDLNHDRNQDHSPNNLSHSLNHDRSHVLRCHKFRLEPMNRTKKMNRKKIKK
jgi:hypothetical protein